MADDGDGELIDFRPRDDWAVLLNPTPIERIDEIEAFTGKLHDRLRAVEETLARLTRPKVEAIYPQNPWRHIANARVLLAEQVADGTIDEATYDEAMGNLAASERELDRSVADAEGTVVRWTGRNLNE